MVWAIVIIAGATLAVADEAGTESGLGSVDDYVKTSSPETNSASPNAHAIALLGIAVNNGEGQLKGGRPVTGVEVLSVNPGGRQQRQE